MPRNRSRSARRGYRVDPLPAGRLQVIQLLTAVAGRHTVHGLIEADVTGTMARLRTRSQPATVTALVVAAVAAAVREHPDVNSRRVGRKLLVFDDVDLIVTVERTSRSGAAAPVPIVVRRADTKTEEVIAAELRTGKTETQVGRASALMTRLPFRVVRTGVSVAGTIPRWAAMFGPPVGVSSLGMFGSGWAIPISPLTVMITVGGVINRPALVDGQFVERNVLPVTLSFDHTVVDGAPAARFASTLVQHLEGRRPA